MPLRVLSGSLEGWSGFALAGVVACSIDRVGLQCFKPSMDGDEGDEWDEWDEWDQWLQSSAASRKGPWPHRIHPKHQP